MRVVLHHYQVFETKPRRIKLFKKKKLLATLSSLNEAQDLAMTRCTVPSQSTYIVERIVTSQVISGAITNKIYNNRILPGSIWSQTCGEPIS